MPSTRCRRRCASHAPDARIDGVLVAPMVGGGVECILGARRDPVFGPMVMFGLGGVFVELLGDVALHSAPVDRRAGAGHDPQRQGLRPAQRRARPHAGRPRLPGRQPGRVVAPGGRRRRHAGQHRHQPLHRPAEGARGWLRRRRRHRRLQRHPGSPAHEHRADLHHQAAARRARRIDPRFALGQSIGLAAFVWGYPLVEIHAHLPPADHRARRRTRCAWQAPIDRLQHSRDAATAHERDIVTPANDLLYTTGWINLANGPRLLHVPSSASATTGRYFVLALYDAWTNNFANPGCAPATRTARPSSWSARAHPPSVDLPAGSGTIRCPTDLVWLIARVVVGDGPTGAARALQSDIRLECPAGTDLRSATAGSDLDRRRRRTRWRRWPSVPTTPTPSVARSSPICASAWPVHPRRSKTPACWPGSRAPNWCPAVFDWDWLDGPLRDGLCGVCSTAPRCW